MVDGPGSSLAHVGHDPLLIAAAVDRGSTIPAGIAGRLADCRDCARLLVDLRALALALARASTPRRRRDYALTSAVAARLRGGGLRAWLARIGTSRDSLTRPLSVAMTTLGLVGLLVAASPVGSGALPGPIDMDGHVEHVAAPAASDGDHRGVEDGSDSIRSAAESVSVPWVLILSWSFLLMGVGLILARWLAALRRMR